MKSIIVLAEVDTFSLFFASFHFAGRYYEGTFVGKNANLTQVYGNFGEQHKNIQI